MTETSYLTINQLTQYIKAKFTKDPYLQTVYVTGEISNFRLRPNGHQYFSLKDDDAVISVVMFKNAYKKLAFKPEEGMKVLVKGHIGVYERQGSYQLYIDEMSPDGIGALYQAYEQLKEKLAKEGLFDFEHKPIPRFPKKIAVVTSQSGAVIRDIITTVNRRYPIVQLVLYPAVVQGNKAKDSLVKQLKRIEANHDYDTVIIGRGGGSIEDLWPFNEEAVVRQVAKMSLPIITSVGHETDTTLVDFVSDERAATPTGAAELATPVLQDEIIRIKNWQRQMFAFEHQRINHLNERLLKVQRNYIFQDPSRLYEVKQLQLDQLNDRLWTNGQKFLTKYKQEFTTKTNQLWQHNPKHHVINARQQFEWNQEKLSSAMNQFLNNQRQHLNQHMTTLDALSPLKQLKKGYSITESRNQQISSINQVDIGDKVKIQVSDGELNAQITGTRKNK
ncbi:exodeoxyribonuclease VII large subunit [Aerococcus suis]|uniref:Exodeoxyribonuclease 7 large subunit n=1 Tax=Aerococcus suis TaxID=371602 RepID=A0A1W1Y1N2_9LACT|nr:exodeoxyribonuclease VII large subunit [Aerococcus suis]MDD7757886.1 exodeoxyribonuclease VII large subunit [Aerococcus suis]MDY4646863.1 exodeoxyribonuclease VII large subunit [Aerococcus suis]SMC30052.1 Exodeoxyribonuclease VII large subunit [Aerococcus suis]